MDTEPGKVHWFEKTLFSRDDSNINLIFKMVQIIILIFFIPEE